MSPVTHQTVKLSKGKHTGPNDGACMMELASMLADEPFSDHPASVCPTIGSFLRAYNDVIDEARRQDLYAYAARIVGSRSSEAVQRARAERLAAWTSSLRQRRWGRLLPGSWGAVGVRRPPPRSGCWTSCSPWVGERPFGRFPRLARSTRRTRWSDSATPRPSGDGDGPSGLLRLRRRRAHVEDFLRWIADQHPGPVGATQQNVAAL